MSRDYSKAKIYCIRNTINSDIYIGSSTDALSKRMVKHRSKAKSEEAQHFKLYQAMNDLGVENFYIELMHTFPCNNSEELHAEEGKCIRERGTLNGRIAGRDKKSWYEENKEEILAKQKEGYEENKEAILERNKKWRDEHQEEQKEYHKQYRENNKEKVAKTKKQCYENKKEEYLQKKREYYQETKAERKVKDKERYEQNKEQVLAKQREKITCECGEVICKSSKFHHKKTQRHQAYLNQQNDN